MFSEYLEINHSDYVVLIMLIPVIEELKYFKFDSCLMLKPSLVPNYFNCDNLLAFMVKAFESLAEWPWPNPIDYFIPVPYMIIHHYVVVASIIIIPEVQWLAAWPINFDWLWGADEVYQWNSNDFLLFIVCQDWAEMELCLSTRHR